MILEKCPQCGHSPVFAIPFFPDLWACPTCPRNKAEELSDRESHARRTELGRELIAIEMRIENVKAIVDDSSADPDERADNILLLRLFLWFQFYLQDQRALPFIKEEVRQLKGLDPTAVPSREVAEIRVALGRPPSVAAQQEKAELELGCAERGIQDFHRNLPWWHETYTITNERIAARAAAKAAPAITTPEPPGGDEPELTATRPNDNRTAEERAADDAWEALGQKAAYREICDWIDTNRKEVACPYGSRGIDSWTAAWAKPGDQKNALDQFLRRRKQKKWPVQ